MTDRLDQVLRDLRAEQAPARPPAPALDTPQDQARRRAELVADAEAYSQRPARVIHLRRPA